MLTDSQKRQSPAFQAAAAEAREDSRRYWAKGGEADQRFPAVLKGWFIPLVDDPQRKLQASIERNRGRRK